MIFTQCIPCLLWVVVLDPQPEDSIVRMGSQAAHQYTLREAKQLTSDPALKQWLNLLLAANRRDRAYIMQH